MVKCRKESCSCNRYAAASNASKQFRKLQCSGAVSALFLIAIQRKASLNPPPGGRPSCQEAPGPIGPNKKDDICRAKTILMTPARSDWTLHCSSFEITN